MRPFPRIDKEYSQTAHQEYSVLFCVKAVFKSQLQYIHVHNTHICDSGTHNRYIYLLVIAIEIQLIELKHTVNEAKSKVQCTCFNER